MSEGRKRRQKIKMCIESELLSESETLHNENLCMSREDDDLIRSFNDTQSRTSDDKETIFDDEFDDDFQYEHGLDSLKSDLEDDETDCEDISDWDESFPKEKLSSQSLSVAEELYIFMVLFNCNKTMMMYLLRLFLKLGHDVPTSVYKFKKPFKTSCIKTVKNTSDNGKYAFLSILDNIKFCLNKKLLTLSSVECALNIFLSVDGISVFKSSNLQIWPILLKFRNNANDYCCKLTYPLPIGIFCGVKKPPLLEFVKYLVDEITHLKQNWFIDDVSGNKFQIGEVSFIADAPARSFLQGIRQHGAYRGCGYCRVPGSYCKDHIIYEGLNFSKRTDFNYYNFLEDNQNCLSPLAKICSFENGFPPDYMHLVCLGVVRKLLNYYFFPNKEIRLKCKIPNHLIQQLNHDIKCFSKSLPNEFVRKLRCLSEFRHYKASEFRTFLVYFSPIFMKKYLPKEYFDHLMLLYVSVISLLSPDAKSFVNVAKSCLSLFIGKMEVLFGRGSLVYNVYCLYHLPDFKRTDLFFFHL